MVVFDSWWYSAALIKSCREQGHKDSERPSHCRGQGAGLKAGEREDRRVQGESAALLQVQGRERLVLSSESRSPGIELKKTKIKFGSCSPMHMMQLRPARCEVSCPNLSLFSTRSEHLKAEQDSELFVQISSPFAASLISKSLGHHFPVTKSRSVFAS